MADNVVINTGTAATVAAEDVGGTQYQRIKIVDGGAASTAGVAASTAQPAAGAVGLVARIAGSVAIVQAGPAIGVTGSISAVGSVSNVGLVNSVSVLGSVSTVGSVGVVNSVSAVGVVNSVSTVGSVGVVNSVSTVGSVGVVNSVSVVGSVNSVASVSVVGSVSTVGGTVAVNVVAGSVSAAYVAGTQFYLFVSSTVGTNTTMLLFTAYVGSAQAANTAGVSLFAIPAGKNLRIVNVQAVAAGSAAALFGQVHVIFASSAATVTVSAIGGRAGGVAMAGSTTVYSQFNGTPLNDIPATQTVGIGISVNASCLIGGIVVQGYLFP